MNNQTSNNQKMIMLPEERYWKMVESYDQALETIAQLKKALAIATNNHKSFPSSRNVSMMVSR